MMDNDQSSGPRRTISGERQATYYIGLVLSIIGFLLFFSVFISVGLAMSGDPFGGGPNVGSFMGRAVAGMGMMILGGVLMNVGSRGVAGSGVLLDPQRARKDLEPWARAGGGIVRDALSEADIDLSGKPDKPGLTFDEKLRRLEQLRAEGILSEEEYRQKRAEILNEKW